jgi:hypothetical protein
MPLTTKDFSSKKEKYMDDLMTLSQYAWENRVDKTLIDRWLENFNYDDEKIIALEILTKFVYFTEKEILRLCEVAFQKLLVRIGTINNERISIDLNSIRTKYLPKCRFFGVGYPSESGSFLLYPFRQRNSLPTSLFPSNLNEIDSSTEFAVFLDDIAASGDTACGFWEEAERISLSGKIRFFYLALLAYDRGIQEIEKNTGFEVIACQTFDDSCRAFTDESWIFPEKERRKKAKEISEKYGKKAYCDWPLGFQGFQGLIGFHHNVPDTTLPIIWAKNGWFPIFERYEKKKVIET